jgi:hypothetical protein
MKNFFSLPAGLNRRDLLRREGLLALPGFSYGGIFQSQVARRDPHAALGLPVR